MRVEERSAQPVEFTRSATVIFRRFGTTAPAKLGYAHGPWITDDTQMTLFAAEGIIRAGQGRWDVDGVALVREVQAAFLRWLSSQQGGDPERIASSPAGWLVTEHGLHHPRAAHAGDSDSTGSMVGNLLGAMYGVDALPVRWLEDLELLGVIDRVARDLHSALEGRVDENAYPTSIGEAGGP